MFPGVKIPGQGGFPMGAVEARQSYSTASFLPVFDLRGQEQIMICPRITLFFHVMVCPPFRFTIFNTFTTEARRREQLYFLSIHGF